MSTFPYSVWPIDHLAELEPDDPNDLALHMFPGLDLSVLHRCRATFTTTYYKYDLDIYDVSRVG